MLLLAIVVPPGHVPFFVEARDLNELGLVAEDVLVERDRAHLFDASLRLIERGIPDEREAESREEVEVPERIGVPGNGGSGPLHEAFAPLMLRETRAGDQGRAVEMLEQGRHRLGRRSEFRARDQKPRRTGTMCAVDERIERGNELLPRRHREHIGSGMAFLAIGNGVALVFIDVHRDMHPTQLEAGFDVLVEARQILGGILAEETGGDREHVETPSTWAGFTAKITLSGGILRERAILFGLRAFLSSRCTAAQRSDVEMRHDSKNDM